MKTFKLILVLLFVFGMAACDNPEPLAYYCGEPQACWVDEDGNTILVDYPAGFAEFNAHPSSPCELGTSTCDSKTGKHGCEDYRPPEEYAEDEVCDGLDNNCNFEADEGTGRTYDDPENDCSFNRGSCLQTQRCVNGAFQCSHLFPEFCVEEKCDGVDNDGDGLVDAEDPDLWAGEPYFFWPENIPVDEIHFGGDSICAPGPRECVDGEIVYSHRGPGPEQCGNGLDDDCDGLTDEVEDPDFEGAYALVFDNSGSMAGHTDNITEAVCNWSQDGTLGQSYFAVIFVGLYNQYAVDEVMLGLDFTNTTELCAYLQAKPWQMMFGGEEHQPQGMMAAHLWYPMLNIDGSTDIVEEYSPVTKLLNWPEGLPKKIIGFSDEMMQLLPYQTMDELTDDCMYHDYTIGMYTEYVHFWPWEQVTNACGGFVDHLYIDQFQIQQSLLQNLTGGC